jgi:hypothetical protein
MRDRATMIGGTLVAGPDGEGWAVELRLPTAAVSSGEGQARNS